MFLNRVITTVFLRALPDCVVCCPAFRSRCAQSEPATRSRNGSRRAAPPFPEMLIGGADLLEVRSRTDLTNSACQCAGEISLPFWDGKACRSFYREAREYPRELANAGFHDPQSQSSIVNTLLSHLSSRRCRSRPIPSSWHPHSP